MVFFSVSSHNVEKEESIRVGIVDDVSVYRKSLRTVLENRPVLEIVAEANDGRSAIDLVDHEKLEILFLAIVGRCGHQQEVTRQSGKKLAQSIAPGET